MLEHILVTIQVFSTQVVDLDVVKMYKFIQFNLIILWNSLLALLWRPEMTLHTFKRQLKAYLFHSSSIAPVAEAVMCTWDDAFLIALSAADCVCVCVQFCMICSTGYHVFRCHSADANLQWLALDMTGISVGILGCYLPAIHYGFYCLSVSYHTLLYYFIRLSVLLSGNLMKWLQISICLHYCVHI